MTARVAAPRAWSLSVRLGWRLAGVLLLAILLAAAAIAWRAIAVVHELDELALQSQIRLVAQHLPDHLDPNARVTLPAELIARFRSSDDDNLFGVFDGDTLVTASNPEALALLRPLMPQPLVTGFLRVLPTPGHKHGLIGLVAPVGHLRVLVLQGHEQTAVLVESLSGSFVLAAIWLLVPIGLAMILVGVLTLRRGLRPLHQVSAAAALVGPSHPGARLPVGALPREVAQLVFAVNDALERLEQALFAQRRFVAEAAHALRTPLAVLTARLDSLEEQPEFAPLRDDADRMGRLVGQLMRMARLESLPLDSTQVVDLHAVAVEAIASLVPLGLRRGVEIALHEATGLRSLCGNPAALVLALTNMLENALAYAPASSTVEVHIRRPATIAVLDRGPGVAPDHRLRIFQRFERGSPPPANGSVSTATHPIRGGAGLGLAIVAEIAAAHGGHVRVEARPGGGAAFVMELPGQGCFSAGRAAPATDRAPAAVIHPHAAAR